MTTRKIAGLQCVTSIALAGLLAGCDSGAGSAGIDGTGAPLIPPVNPVLPAPTPPSAPAAANVIAYGAITGFGSVWLNGVRYDTSHATFTINGQLGTQADLAIGDVVLLIGTLDPDGSGGVAQRVVFDSLVQGPISAVDAAAHSLVALGQTVETGDDTWFDAAIPNRSLTGLRIGNVVKVSGFRAENGAIKATRIAIADLGRRELETTGAVSDLDVVARRFHVSALVVDYGSAMLEGFPAGAIGDADVVEVRGSSLLADGALVATSVTLQPGVSGNAGDRVEIEGYMTSLYPITPYSDSRYVRFSVERLTVETTDLTVYEGGSGFNLWHDIRVEVEGALRADGVLIATKVRFSYVDPVKITSRVDAVSTMAGSFTTLGITVKTDVLTQVVDSSAAHLAPFRLTNLVAGDYVSVSGIEFPADSGEVLASAIERRDATTETRLKGHFQSATWPAGAWRYPMPWLATLQILGVTVATNENTLYGWENSLGVNGATFWDDMSPGALIEARGVQIGDRTIEARQLLYATGP